MDTDELMAAFNRRMAEGYLYGDCQFSTDVNSDSFPKNGVFSCYRPLPPEAAMPAEVKEARRGALARALLPVARRYAPRLRDLCVLLPVDFGTALLVRHEPDEPLSRRLPRGARSPATGQGERHVISELYVPRAALAAFLAAVRADLRQHGAQLIYGRIRLIEKDEELPRLGARAVGLH